MKEKKKGIREERKGKWDKEAEEAREGKREGKERRKT